MKTLKCKNPDCNEQRMLNNKTGAYFTYCETHQREYWRTKSNAKQPGKNVAMRPLLNDSAGDNGTSIEPEHAKTSRLSEAKKQAIIDRVRQRVALKKVDVANPPQVVPPEKSDAAIAKVAAMFSVPIQEWHEPDVTFTPVEPAVDCADSTCTECVYRDVVELLEKRVPGVRELLTGLKAIRK